MKSLIFPALLLLLCSCARPDTPQPEAQTDVAKKILIVGGDQHHDFDRWFNQEDAATLEAAGYEVSYTDDPAAVHGMMEGLDILYLSNNQALPDPELRQAIFDFADAGKGLLLVHPALWYNWEDWPAYNRELAGGGSRSHPPYGPFDITVTAPDHPIMAGVPATFTLDDELYRYELDPQGPALNVLMTGREAETGDEFPLAWTVNHPTRRIVGITLGHDGATHQSDAYKTMLVNAADWLIQ